MNDELEQKISAARTRLILDKPFLGVLVLRLPMVAAKPQWCPTTATDTKNLYYNPQYLDALGTRQIEFVLAHEALHCALSHFSRRGHRDKRRWDLACDFAINPVLLAEGLRPPPNAITFVEYAGMTAEEIYPLLQDNDNTESMDQHLDDAKNAPESNPSRTSKDDESGQGLTEIGEEPSMRPPPLSQSERELLDKQWQHQRVVAAQRAAQAGKLNGALANLVDTLLHPKLSWRALLARYVVTRAHEDYDYTRPSRREGEAILPRLHSRQIDVAVVLDTSGSIRATEIQEFLAEIDALKAQVRARITLFACDTEIAPGAPWVFDAWDELKLPQQLPRGGGTRFTAPFAWYAQRPMTPDLLVYFTDALGQFPEIEPAFPVLWLVKGKAPVPWGMRVQLN